MSTTRHVKSLNNISSATRNQYYEKYIIVISNNKIVITYLVLHNSTALVTNAMGLFFVCIQMCQNLWDQRHILQGNLKVDSVLNKGICKSGLNLQ